MCQPLLQPASCGLYCPVKVGRLSDYSGVVTAPATAAYGVVRFQVRNCRFFLTHLDVDTRSAARTWIRPNSTLIDGNKIYTGDAYVDTLQIKGQAVTVAAYGDSPGTVALANGGYVAMLWIGQNMDGAEGFFVCSFSYSLQDTGSSNFYRPLASASIRARLMRGNTVIHDFGTVVSHSERGNYSGSGEGGSVSITASFSGARTLSCRVPANNSWQTYTLQLEVSASDRRNVRHRGGFIMGRKR